MRVSVLRSTKGDRCRAVRSRRTTGAGTRFACFHDKNDNGVLDTGPLGVPTEGVVASRNAKGFMGRPRFNDAKFTFAGNPTELRRKMGH